jgi:BirA family transcriptional regulator, biotin operon repressor / biotin---[acetyl-CoA-carboxylase] ligase
MESSMTSSAHAYFPLLDITKIGLALRGSTIGHTIEYQASMPSTMPLAVSLAAKPATRSGMLVVAEAQTAGQGRMQRVWEAPYAQGLLVSLILKAPHLPANPAQLPMLAGLATVRAIVRTAPELTDEIGLKWPNDVLLGADLAGGRKVAGVLIETAFRQQVMDFAVIGIGINVNQGERTLPTLRPSMPPPTSLRIQLGRMVDRTDLLIALGQAWEELLGPKQAEHDIYHEWRNLLYTLGQPVVARSNVDGDVQPISGTAVDVTADGELVVTDEAGVTHLLSAGDVTTRPD